MSSKNFLSSLSVAILISDIDEVKEITNVFRKLGVIPYFYEDLKSFWHGSLEKMPTIAIVDVKKMSEGNLVLKNHPFVMTEELPLLFYYSEQTEPLLVSTQEIFHLGSVKKATNYEGIFKGLLKRINKMISLEQENHNLKLSVHAKNEELKILEQKIDTTIKIDHYQALSRNLCHQLSDNHENKEFTQILDHLIQETKEFDSYSIVELSFNGQKIISPLIHGRKFRALPSIWLGQVCKEGIELFAQNMAAQVVTDVLGPNSVALTIQGSKQNPEMIVYIKAADDLCFNYFDWQLFESFINGLFTKQKLKEGANKNYSNSITNAFEAMSYLDNNSFSFDSLNTAKKVDDVRIVNVDLRSIGEIILKNGEQRFFWQKFFQDFVSRLELQVGIPFQSFIFGVDHISFVVEGKNCDKFFGYVKEFSEKFSYWKYFENNDSIIFQEVRPNVFMTPTSAFGYLNRIKQQAETKSSNNLYKTSIKWERENLNEI